MKTKRLTKLGAVLSAALVLLSGILSVSAASVPQAVIDTGRKAPYRFINTILPPRTQTVFWVTTRTFQPAMPTKTWKTP